MNRKFSSSDAEAKAKRPQSIEDDFQLLLASQNALKNLSNSADCLDEDALQSLWYSIAAVSTKKELRKRILPFFEDPEKRNEDETLVLLEILEFLYSKNGFQPLLKSLDDETVVDFLSHSVTSGSTQVQERSLYLITLICDKLKPTTSEISGIVELKDALANEKNLVFTKPLNSKYFLYLNEKDSPSPPKRSYLRESKNPQTTSRFENLFTKSNDMVPRVDNEGKKSYRNSQEDCYNQEYSDVNCSSEGDSQEYSARIEISQNVKKFSNESNDLASFEESYQPVPLRFKASDGQNAKDVKIENISQNSYNNATLDETPHAAQNNNAKAESFLLPGQQDSDMSLQNKQESNRLQVNTIRQADTDTLSFLNDSANTYVSQKSALGRFQTTYSDSPIVNNVANSSPMSLISNSPAKPQDSNKSVLDQLEMHNSSKGCLQLDELLEYKRVGCPQKNCPLRNFIASQEQFLYENDMYQCPYFHNHADRRRYPLHKHNLAKSFYVHDKMCEDCFNDPNKHKGRCYYCKNWFEVFFHPKNYKLLPCQNKYCNKTNSYCPFFHQPEEKYEWDRILMSEFQYDRKNIVFSVEVLTNTNGQSQPQNKTITNNINMF